MRLGACAAAFLLALATYWLTVAPDASYWDCPEYALTAVTLDIGHPPGNPFWTLVHRVVTILAPSGAATLAINMTSGIFSAGAAALLCSTAFFPLEFLLRSRRRKVLSDRAATLTAAASALCGALAFAWCDSTWFSAVEAEVYSFSIFLTALMIRIMEGWCLVRRSNPALAWRLIMLNAYISGLSLCVHQLNLLVYPALALIWIYASPRKVTAGRFFMAILVSMAMIAVMLLGIMPGTAALAAEAELICVNTLHLPAGSGAIIYIALTAISVISALALTGRLTPDGSSGNIRRSGLKRTVAFVAIAAALSLSGVFMMSRSETVTAFLTTVAAFILVSRRRTDSGFSLRILWMLALVLAGFSSYMLVPIRSAANPPVNEGCPSDPFAFKAYIQREQYGSSPLLYGPTPYSRPLFSERINSDSTADYSSYELQKGEPVYVPALKGAKTPACGRMLTPADSVANTIAARRVSETGEDAYLKAGHRLSHVMTPELDMWFPRIHGRTPSDIDCYRSWLDMDTAKMVRTAVSEAVDSAGNFVCRRGPDGKRISKYSYRPTYLQNLDMLATYQISYMYLRYLLWNFSGRQNDIAAGGEADHGNFITGFQAIDDAMLGPQRYLPDEARGGNAGFNRYYMLPLLAGLAGAIALCFHSRRGRRLSMICLTLFVMTGIAIVIYLNQDIGQARERDYTFLGSYYAFCLWIAAAVALGAEGAARLTVRLGRSGRRSAAATAIAVTAAFAIPLLMLAENYDDHNRSGNTATPDFARNILESLPHDAILFTDGDNYTFPLWYAQEVLGVRPDVSIVNINYLSLPSYAASLHIPGRTGRAVEMTASPSDLLYGRYSSVILTPVDSAIDAGDALRGLYAGDGRRPRLDGLISIQTADSAFTVNLRSAAGSGMLRQRQLVMLDIAVSSVLSDRPRPVCWMNILPRTSALGLDPLLRRGLYTRILDPAGILPAGGIMPENIRWGGYDAPEAPYGDITYDRQASFQRYSLLRHASSMLETGDTAGAVTLTRTVLSRLPLGTIRPDVVADPDSAVHEAEFIARLLAREAKSREAGQMLDHAIKVLDNEISRSRDWQRYIASLPASMRSLVSPHGRRLAGREKALISLRDSIKTASHTESMVRTKP